MSELTITQEQNAVALAAQALTQDIAEAHQAMGMIKAFSFVEKLLTVGTLKILRELKTSKKYKGLSYIDQDGKVLTVGSWEQYCKACGLSVNKVDEDLQNLNTFGENFLEESQRLGLGYRDLRKLRKLPEEARAEIIDADYSEATDKEELIEKIEDLTAKFAHEKKVLEGQLKQSHANYEAQSKVIASKDNKINSLAEELEKKKKEIETRTPDKKGGDLRKEVAQLSFSAEAILRGQVRKGFETLMQHTQESGIDHVQFMSGLIAEVELMLIELKQEFGLFDTPTTEAEDWSIPDAEMKAALDGLIAQETTK